MHHHGDCRGRGAAQQSLSHPLSTACTVTRTICHCIFKFPDRLPSRHSGHLEILTYYESCPLDRRSSHQPRMALFGLVCCITLGWLCPFSRAQQTSGQGAGCAAAGYSGTWCTLGCLNGKCCGQYSACGALNCGSTYCCYLTGSDTTCGSEFSDFFKFCNRNNACHGHRLQSVGGRHILS